MLNYKIYQIKDIENTDYAFRGYDPKKFKFADYECMYEGEYIDHPIDYETGEQRTATDILEELFVQFNVSRPNDFKGHSMSMSDVVELEKDGRRLFFYCDTFGFKLLDFEPI